MRKTTAKVLAMLLTVVMLIGIAPTAAFAKEELPSVAEQVYEEKPASFEEKENEKKIEEITVPVSVGDNTIAATGQCGDNVYWMFDEETGALTISGEGDMENHNIYLGDSPFYGNASIKSVTIESGVTSIGGYAFYDCSSLTSIKIPDSVTSIGNGAFEYCGLTSIVIPDSVTSIGDWAFCVCSGLTSITIPDSVTSIGYGAFYNCTSLTSIEIPNSVTSIGTATFAECYVLSNITIPASVTSIGDVVFYGCSELTDISISDSVTEIGDHVFSDTGYYNSESNWENGLLYIGKYLIAADRNNEEQNAFVVKDGTTCIATQAFAGCWWEYTVTIPESVTSIGVWDYTGDVFDVTIKCYENSYAHQYAIDNEIAFELIDNEETIVTVSFDANGGTVDTASIEVESGSTIPSMPSATKTGYKFDGWFTEKTGGTKVDTTTVINENLTVYAHWTAIKYTVKFYDDTVLLGTKDFTYDQTDALSYSNSVPTKEGYDFLGWANTKDSVVYFANGTQAKNLASTDGAVVVFYAIWEEVIPEQQTVIDQTTGIEMDITSGTYDGDVTMNVEEVLSGSSFVLAGKVENASSTKIFSIKTFVDGQEVQPNGYVTVKIPVPAGFNASRCKIYYLDVANDTTVEMPVTVEGNYLVFKTNHFSDWAVIETKASIKSVSLGDRTIDYKSSANLNPQIVADEGAKYSVSYKSSDQSVISVDGNGKVTSNKTFGFSQGSATITVTVTDENGNTVQDTCKVSVKFTAVQWLIKILLFGWIWY